jgi:hypothetical protein
MSHVKVCTWSRISKIGRYLLLFFFNRFQQRVIIVAVIIMRSNLVPFRPIIVFMKRKTEVSFAGPLQWGGKLAAVPTRSSWREVNNVSVSNTTAMHNMATLCVKRGCHYLAMKCETLILIRGDKMDQHYAYISHPSTPTLDEFQSETR